MKKEIIIGIVTALAIVVIMFVATRAKEVVQMPEKIQKYEQAYVAVTHFVEAQRTSNESNRVKWDAQKETDDRQWQIILRGGQ